MYPIHSEPRTIKKKQILKLRLEIGWSGSQGGKFLLSPNSAHTTLFNTLQMCTKSL